MRYLPPAAWKIFAAMYTVQDESMRQVSKEQTVRRGHSTLMRYPLQLYIAFLSSTTRSNQPTCEGFESTQRPRELSKHRCTPCSGHSFDSSKGNSRPIEQRLSSQCGRTWRIIACFCRFRTHSILDSVQSGRTDRSIMSTLFLAELKPSGFFVSRSCVCG